MRWRLVAFVALLALVAPSAAAVAGDDGAGVPETTECAPPCGEINPRILFEFDELSDDPITLSEGESATFSGEVTYWADTDDEGYSPRDPQQPVVLRFSFPRLPEWAEMSVEPQEIEVPVNTCAQCFNSGSEDATRPTAHWAYSQEIELTVTAKGQAEATAGYDYGKLQLFAKSTESGIYNPGYGIREVRVSPDASTLETNSADSNDAPGPSVLAAVGVLATVGALAAVRRRA